MWPGPRRTSSHDRIASIPCPWHGRMAYLTPGPVCWFTLPCNMVAGYLAAWPGRLVSLVYLAAWPGCWFTLPRLLLYLAKWFGRLFILPLDLVTGLHCHVALIVDLSCPGDLVAGLPCPGDLFLALPAIVTCNTFVYPRHRYQSSVRPDRFWPVTHGPKQVYLDTEPRDTMFTWPRTCTGSHPRCKAQLYLSSWPTAQGPKS